LDFLRDLVGNAGNLLWVEPGAKVLLEVLPMTWTSPFENRHRILKHCRWAAERPEVALQHLDEVQRLAPLVLPHLHDTLAWLWLEPEDPRDDETLFSIICDKIGGVGPTVCETDYELYRQHLLRLCITEVIAPETVVNIWDGNSSSFGFQRVHEDWPLRTVCLAHRLILA
jgi:hypothetical protein